MENEKNFEKRLKSSLKQNGYLFPTTDEEVANFEKLYGNTDLAIPSEIDNPEAILKNRGEKPVESEEEFLACAAFHSKDETELDKLFEEGEKPDQVD